MLCLGIEFLTGYCVATHPSARDRPEWPPHPARVFMAMAAAYFESGADPVEGNALRQLEALHGLPEILASSANERTPVTHYVPVNDGLDYKNPTLPLLRVRQPREFPRVRPECSTMYLRWPDAQLDDTTLAALKRVCEKVTRIGHSSSLVRMWVQELDPPNRELPIWITDGEGFGDQLRIFGNGSLDELAQRYRADETAEYDRLVETVSNVRGKDKAQAKQTLESRFAGGRPVPIRPEFQITASYHAKNLATDKPLGTKWSRDFISFALSPLEKAHTRLDIISSPAVARMLHKALISAAQQVGTVPEYISGHQPDGAPSENPHCAPIPLPFVGHEHADGHLLGVAIAFPKQITSDERRSALKIAAAIKELVLGRLGKWALIPVQQLSAPQTLRSKTWSGDQAGSREWASVTPIVFDEHPKSKDIDGYQDEICRMVSVACSRIDLPDPEQIEISHVAFLPGVPTAREFPRMARKDGSLRRHLHCRIIFAQPVTGPVLLGAGRYRGYGLMRPLLEVRQNG